MKTLKNHLILFDAECPLCRVYTQAFVETGLLEHGGRAAYQEYPAEACPMLDRQRAANEIALINKSTGEVTYGVESLFKIFAISLPALRPLLSFRPFVWLMSKFYAFISYNRRVIVPAPVATNEFEFQPAFRPGYRIAYLIATWILTALILSAYAPLLQDLLPGGSVYREYFICGGQILFQGIVVSLADKGKSWDYLGNIMTISVGGALGLLPVLLVAQWLDLDPLFYAIWFMGIAGLMFLEHIRRTRILNLNLVLTTTWVLYRILILLLILLVN